MVVIIENADAPFTAVAMRPEVVIPSLQQVEVARGRGQTLRHGAQSELGLAEVERGIQVATQHFEVAIGIAVVTGHLADQKEIGLAEVGGIAVVPRPAEGRKCARSWKILPSVGSDPQYPDVSPRDAQALREWDAMAKAAE